MRRPVMTTAPWKLDTFKRSGSRRPTSAKARNRGMWAAAVLLDPLLDRPGAALDTLKKLSKESGRLAWLDEDRDRKVRPISDSGPLRRVTFPR